MLSKFLYWRNEMENRLAPERQARAERAMLAETSPSPSDVLQAMIKPPQPTVYRRYRRREKAWVIHFADKKQWFMHLEGHSNCFTHLVASKHSFGHFGAPPSMKRGYGTRCWISSAWP